MRDQHQAQPDEEQGHAPARRRAGVPQEQPEHEQQQRLAADVGIKPPPEGGELDGQHGQQGRGDQGGPPAQPELAGDQGQEDHARGVEDGRAGVQREGQGGPQQQQRQGQQVRPRGVEGLPAAELVGVLEEVDLAREHAPEEDGLDVEVVEGEARGADADQAQGQAAEGDQPEPPGEAGLGGGALGQQAAGRQAHGGQGQGHGGEGPGREAGPVAGAQVQAGQQERRDHGPAHDKPPGRAVGPEQEGQAAHGGNLDPQQG